MAVGELAAHSHTASSNTTGEHNHGINARAHNGADTAISYFESANSDRTYYTNNAVGELPSHNHTATISTTNLTGWFTNNGNSDTANGDGTIFKASKRTGQGSSSGGAADGGKFTFNGAHAHTIAISNIGSSQPHNNIQPYIAVYIWKRVN